MNCGLRCLSGQVASLSIFLHMSARRQSLQNVHQNAPGCSLHFSKGPVKAHREILESFRAVDASYALEDRKAMFVDWFCSHYKNHRVHDSVESGNAETLPLQS